MNALPPPLPPPVPDSEVERIRVLKQYDALSAAQDRYLTEIAELIAKLCEAPFALITFVDTDSVVFKAKVGLDAVCAPRTDRSFCAHAIMNPTHIFEIVDATQDIRFEHSGFGSYAGACIVSPCGQAVGALCVLDTKPRKFSEVQLNSLRVLSRQIRDHLELLKTLDEQAKSLRELQLTQAALLLSQQALEASNQAKSRFLAVMTHEVRTPLHAIFGLASLALDEVMHLKQSVQRVSDQGVADQPSRALRHSVRLLEHHLLRMNSASSVFSDLLNNVLDFSKLEEGKLQVEMYPFELHNLLDVLLDFSRANGSKRSVHVELVKVLPLPTIVVSDRIRLAQICLNLLDNAVKFSPAGSTVMFEVSVKDRQSISTGCVEPMLQFSVTDKGVGVPADRLEKIFLPFEQAETSTTRKFGGSGLGLAIAKSLSELLHGELAVSSQPGKGSTFSISIPIVPIQIHPPVDSHPSSDPAVQHTVMDRMLVSDIRKKGITGCNDRSPRNLSTLTESLSIDDQITGDSTIAGRVLLVDDNPFSRTVSSHMLYKGGFVVESVSNGVEALKCLSTNNWNFDLVLTDCSMPEMDGYTLASSIRSLEKQRKVNSRRLPIVALSGSTSSEHINRCQEVGIDDIIAKPISQVKLLSLLHRRLHSNVNKNESTPHPPLLPLISS